MDKIMGYRKVIFMAACVVFGVVAAFTGYLNTELVTFLSAAMASFGIGNGLEHVGNAAKRQD